MTERSQRDVSPIESWGCLALHWRRWQAIGAESWVVTVLRDGYRVPFTDSPPPLSRTPVSFPTYRACSPQKPSTCGSFRENLLIEVRADFERLILSGSRALEFLASQGITALNNLVLSRRDSLLVDFRSTVPAEEVARLRYSPLPETVSLFPSPLLDSALTKMRAAANDALVQRTLHPPRIPRKPAAGGGSARSSSAGSAQVSSSGASRPAQKQSATSSPSGQSGKKRKNRKGKAPFSSSSGGSGRSGGKGKGAGKKST